MNKLYCLIGKSASGKSTIYNELLKQFPSCLKPYVLYTTRPKRRGEKDGVDYYFVTPEIMNKFRKEDKVIEEKAYATNRGLWTYAIVYDGQCDFSKYSYLIICTPKAYKELKSFLTPELIEPIYIEVEDGDRLMRAIDREGYEKHPDYFEVCRRFISDTIDYSEDKLKELGIVKKFQNEDWRKCAKAISEAMNL